MWISASAFHYDTINYSRAGQRQNARQVEERINNTHDVARLTIRFFLHGEEGLATQLGAAGHADEAVHMEDLVHGGAAGAFTYHVLSAACTAACWGTEDGRLRPLSPRIKGRITYSSTHLPSVPTLQRLK